MRIAGDGFLRRTLRPLSENLEGSQKKQDFYQSATEHGTTSLGSPIPSIGYCLGWMQNSDEGWPQQLYCRTVSGHVSVQDKSARRISAAGVILGGAKSARKPCIKLGLVLSVTGFTFSRRRLVEKHGLSFDSANDFVTFVTSDVPVSTFERKRSALVVVKLRWLPAG